MTVRSVTYNSWEILYNKDIQLNQLLNDLVKTAEEGNPQVSNLSLICLKEIISAVKMSVEPCLSAIFEVSYRVAQDKNEVLAENGVFCLEKLVESCTESKIFTKVLQTWNKNSFFSKFLLAHMILVLVH